MRAPLVRTLPRLRVPEPVALRPAPPPPTQTGSVVSEASGAWDHLVQAVGGDRTRSLLGGTEACFPLHLDRAG